jgi:wyosine [tRNA(Phe)-imidazoG37] synthetase (radical SAM superfamily)
MNRHIFGPVLSRRLGRSLGVDLLPFKTCTFSCVYCECGATTSLMTKRSEFFPASTVIAELDQILSKQPGLDYITFAGSGEPTLSLSIGPVITHIKTTYPCYSVAVLTNGSLCTRADVRNDLLMADLTLPTLTTADQQTFDRIHRPHPSLRIDAIIAGMEQFRKMYTGILWLEIFIIPGLNTTADELAGLKGAIERINPDRVQLNTLDRPPAEGWVQPAPDAELERIRDVLGRSGIEIISRTLPVPRTTVPDYEAVEMIRATLRRRPSTIEDLVRTTGMSGGELAKILAALEQEGMVMSQRGTRGVFYTFRRKNNANGGT